MREGGREEGGTEGRRDGGRGGREGARVGGRGNGEGVVREIGKEVEERRGKRESEDRIRRQFNHEYMYMYMNKYTYIQVAIQCIYSNISHDILIVCQYSHESANEGHKVVGTAAIIISQVDISSLLQEQSCHSNDTIHGRASVLHELAKQSFMQLVRKKQ